MTLHLVKLVTLIHEIHASLPRDNNSHNACLILFSMFLVYDGFIYLKFQSWINP